MACKSERKYCISSPLQTCRTRKTGVRGWAEHPTFSSCGTSPNSDSRIFPDRELTRIEPSARQSTQLRSQVSSSVGRRADRAYVVVANFSGEELNVTKATVLGVAEEVSEDLVDKINA